MTSIRLLRNVILASIALAALLAIVAILGVEIGETGFRIIGTSFLVTGAALIAMPSLAAWEQHRLGPLPLSGVAMALVGFAWLIVGVWVDYGGHAAIWKVPVSLVIAATAIAGISLVGFARLEPAWSWLQPSAAIAMSGVAGALIAGLWGEFDNDFYWRAFGVAAVVMTALLASIPILHQRIDASVTVSYCPFCGASISARLGVETACPQCDRKFSVTQ